MSKKGLFQKVRAYVNNKIAREEFVRECLMCEYSVRDLAEAYYDAVEEMESTEKVEVPPVRITQEQLQTYFKIIGLNAQGEIEQRGRKKKD